MKKLTLKSRAKSKIALGAVLAMGLLSGHSYANGKGYANGHSYTNGRNHADSDRFVDVARVTKVTPLYTTVEREIPERQCWVEQVREEHPRRGHHKSATITIVGGIVGGAIGNAIGNDSGNKKVGTVVGSILGMSVGNDIGRHHRNHHDSGYSDVSYRDVERCEVRHRIETERELVGYNVTYRYRGRSYTTEMDHDPGKELRVAVNVRPMNY